MLRTETPQSGQVWRVCAYTFALQVAPVAVHPGKEVLNVVTCGHLILFSTPVC